MLRIAFMGAFSASLVEPVRRRLSIPCEIAVSGEVGIVSRLSEVDVLVTMALTREIGRAATRLKLVQVPGAGLDRIDRSALPHGVALANVYGHETGIAEYVVGAMLTLTREFSRLDAALRVGEWKSQWAIGSQPPPVWPELANRTIEILGYGRIGRAVAHRARAFDMKICAIRRNLDGIEDDPAVLGGPDIIDEVLQRSDYVVIAMPATPDTIGSIDRRQLSLMKSTAFLVNVSRAKIVDENALYDALAQRSIAGAALDVWYCYPRQPGPAAPATRPFHELPNVLMTPHVSSWTDGMLHARAELIAKNIRRAAAWQGPAQLGRRMSDGSAKASSAQRATPPLGGIGLPLYYGWVLVAVAFVTMAVGVNARTAFSLLFPAILDEFGWDRGMTAGAFSFGFLVSALVTPCIGWAMDLRGPRLVIELGVVAMGAGLILAVLVREPWQLYLSLGALVGGGVNCLAYTGQSLYLTNWFVRRRGLALSIAFSGVGIGSITVLPWVASLIANAGWRAACLRLGILVLVLLAPLNLLLRRRPEDFGLEPDGMASGSAIVARTANVVDHAWAAIDWTLWRAVRTARFWWLAGGYFCGLFTWYAVQVHQTKYLIEVGFGPGEAALALGVVSLVAIPGQIALGHLSDRIGREWVWAIGNMGFVLCCLLLILLHRMPNQMLLYAMVLAQGTIGYSLTSVMGAIPAEIFEGPHFGRIFGSVMVAAILGGAAGPWLTGAMYDATGSYSPAFWIAAGCSTVSALAIWLAAPRKVRTVAGRADRLAAG